MAAHISVAPPFLLRSQEFDCSLCNDESEAFFHVREIQ